MKKLLLAFGMILVSILYLSAQTTPMVNWHNGKVLGWGNLTKSSNAADKAECVDRDGNIYVASCISRSPFGATKRILYIGGDSVVIGLNQTAVVVSKFDSTGALIWKKTGISSNNGGTIAPEAQSIKVGTNGKVYFSFSFVDTITFGSTMLLDDIVAPNNKADIALMELEASNGNINWSKIIYKEYAGSGQANDEFTSAFDINNAGQIVFVIAADSLIFRTYSSSGDLLKSKSYFVDPGYLSVYAYTASGPNIVLAASLMNSFNLGSATINKTDGETVVAVFDMDGNFKWVRQVRSSAQFSGSGARIFGLTQTASGSVYATGGFWGTCKVKGYADSLVAGVKRTGGADNGEELMYMKFGPTGTIEWLKQANGESSHRGRKIITTPGGKLLLLSLIGSRTFFIGTDSLPQPPVASGTDRYAIIYLDTTAQLIWAKRINESGGISSRGINLYTDAASNIFFTSGTGVFSNVSFPTVSPSLEYGFFMFVKSSDIAGAPNPTGVQSLIEYSRSLIYPNPVRDVLTIQTPKQTGTIRVTVYDVTGKTVLQTKTDTGIVDVQSIPNGLYILSVETDKDIFTQRFIKN